MEIHVKVEGLDEAFETMKVFPGEADKAIDETMRIASLRGYQWMYPITPIKTGELRASLFSRQTSPYRMEIGATAPHSIFVHQGTRAHEIRPVRAKALRFMMGGKVIFARRVWHPGTRAQPFVKITVDRLVEFIRTEFLKRMRTFITGRVT